MLGFDNVQIDVGSFRLSVDAEVRRGQRLSILGTSGTGKSTLLSAIAGFLKPTEGRLTWEGAPLNEAPPSVRPISILFQDGNLFPHLSIADNVGLALRTDLRLSTEQRFQVDGSLDRVGLDGMGARKPADLSGGQQSRAALARLLLQDRPVVLLDEPFAALDPGLRSGMLDLLDDLSGERGLTLLLSTHDLRDAERLCERVWVLQDGAVALDRPTDGLRADPPDLLKPWL